MYMYVTETTTEQESTETTDRLRGKTKFFNEFKGFGFIRAENGNEYFVHISGIQDQLALDQGMNVEFSVEQGDKGPKAVDVEILSKQEEVDVDLSDEE